METHFYLSWLIFAGVTVNICFAQKSEKGNTTPEEFTCPMEWISDAAGKCYRLYTADDNPQIKRVRQAAKTCANENATLARVRYMRDRLFLSGLFKKWHQHVDTWYVGGKKKRGQWYSVTLVEKKINRRKQGRATGTRTRLRLAVVTSDPISDKFLNLDNKLMTCHRSVSYPCGNANFLTLSNRITSCSSPCEFLAGYYWRATWSFSRAGLNFVCEKEAKQTSKLPKGIQFGVCGRRVESSANTKNHGRVSLKIAGGNSAPYGKHPWQAGMKRVEKGDNGGVSFNDAPVCGAAIINEFWLLSVAHCYRNASVEDLRVIVGEHSLVEKDAGEDMFEIEAIVPYEKFIDGSREGFDISLIKIKARNGSGMAFNHYIQPACLPTLDMPHVVGQNCWITGWGSLGGIEHPSELMEAQVPLVNQEVCEALMTGPTQNRTLCAGDLDQIKAWRTACQGDSGGPLVCEYRGAQTVVGITSWGHYCGNFPPLKIGVLDNGRLSILVYPSVFTRVQSFLPWIEKTMRQYSSSPSDMELPRRP